MKTIKNVIFSTALMFLMASCASTVKFPVSNVTPAADISAKMKKDNNDNYAIMVTANHIANAERLSPPRKTYVVWISTKNNGVHNIGQMKINDNKKCTLQTLSPFEPQEIFITAEDSGTVSYPSGVEITRTVFDKLK